MDIQGTKPTRPPLSIGVVTHDRAVAFSKLLQYLIPAIDVYGIRCEVIVVNNSGHTAHDQIESIVSDSEIRTVCECRVMDSNKNNISTGRNIVMDNARETHLVFVDDDEYPISTWLITLVDAMLSLDCKLIAGPILPVFPETAKTWVKAIDLHNTDGLTTGDSINYAASGNFLINRKGVEDLKFDESFGKSGGEDTDFFLQLKDRGHLLYWCSEAIVYEDIPVSKSTPEYMIKRFITQGRSYRNIREIRGELQNPFLFTLRAVMLASTSIVIAKMLMQVRPVSAAKWMKRGYSNLGKIIQPDRHLYE